MSEYFVKVLSKTFLWASFVYHVLMAVQEIRDNELICRMLLRVMKKETFPLKLSIYICCFTCSMKFETLMG